MENSDPLDSFRTCLEMLGELEEWEAPEEEFGSPLYWHALGKRLFEVGAEWPMDDVETRIYFLDKSIEALLQASQLDTTACPAIIAAFAGVDYPVMIATLARAYRERGSTFFIVHDYEQAFLDYEEALKYSQHPDYHIARAQAAYHIGAWQMALEDYELYLAKGDDPALREEAAKYIPLIRAKLMAG